MMSAEQLVPSAWTIDQARSAVDRLRQVPQQGDPAAGIELFEALCGYLDELYGDEFDAFLHPEDQALVAGEIDRIRTTAPTGSPISAEHADDVVIRLDQPVNSPVSLAEGRELASRLAAAGDWAAELGRALTGLYGYLDQLYGGEGRFVELLSRSERAAVAAALAGADQGLPRT